MACSKEYLDALTDDGHHLNEEYSSTSYLEELIPLTDFGKDDMLQETRMEISSDIEPQFSFESSSNSVSDDDDYVESCDNSICCEYSVNGKLDSLLVVSAALVVLIVEKDISVVAFNCIMDTLMITGFIQTRLTWKSMCRVLKRRLMFSSTVIYSVENFNEHDIALFDLKVQLELILYRHLETIKTYRQTLIEGNGDVLCSSKYLNCYNPFIIHLHLSTDGGQLYKYKRRSLWPVHATLLDLPLNIRSKPENLILMALWDGRRKPDWSTFLRRYLNASCINKEIILCIGTIKLNVVVKLHTGVFDLPAMASILNHAQFNGEFGCIYCCSPGVSLRVGRGHSRKYGGVDTVITDKDYSKYSGIADQTSQTIFGIKGKSCLSDYIRLPSHVLLDPLHLLFENCAKLMISKLIHSSSYREKYFLGRHVDSYRNEFKLMRLPSIVPKPRPLNDISFWKGRDFMSFVFYFSIPTIFKSLFYKPSIDNEYAFHFLVFVYACKLCYLKSARSQSQNVKELFQYFHSRLSVLYDNNICSINMHLMLHLHAQIKKFGSLANCSMFSFERQFFNFKTYRQGVNFLLHQLCEKLTLLKHCKSFLEVCNFDRKTELLKCISLKKADHDEFVFRNEGVIMKGNRPFFSETYTNKNVSSFYEIEKDGHVFYVSVTEFYVDNGVFGKAKFYERIENYMFNFSSWALPEIPDNVVEIMNEQTCFVCIKRKPYESQSIPVSLIRYPCVVYDAGTTNQNFYLLMPCSSVAEFC